ncbi:MAG: Ig-like domain-containing protein [Prevotellaceae bacterium]|jgi:uncharacterized protein YjdB|nr:Ig-like domain-containing protein [Prevotellaceae bacterium]
MTIILRIQLFNNTTFTLNFAPVTIPVTDVTLNKASTTLTAGGSETLVATVTPSNAANQTVSWHSSNTAVAAVDATGKVTAMAAGTATTQDGGFTASCEVTVEKAARPHTYLDYSITGNTVAVWVASGCRSEMQPGGSGQRPPPGTQRLNYTTRLGNSHLVM